MIKEALIVLLTWVDPTVQVVPVSLVCTSEPAESLARNDQLMKNNMSDFGKGKPGMIVDPYGVLSNSQREALERSAGKTGSN